MSVINRMLKDLDKRQNTTRTQTYTPAAVAPQPIHWIWIILTVLISGAVIVGSLNLWWMYSDKQADEQGMVDVVQATSNGKSEISATPVSEPEPVVVDSTAEARQQLSPPKVNQAIVDISALPTTAAMTPATEQDTKQIATAATEAAAEPTVSPTNTQPKPQVVKKSAEPAGTLEVTRVQLSPEALAANNLDKARAAFSKGNRDEGQALLEKALVVKPDHVEVRSELAAYWYGRGMTTRALTLLQQGLDMRPQQPQWQLLFARILERIGRVEQAYSALINIRNDVPEARELLQLRAMAATQLGYFSDAAADYTVLATATNEGRWWLAAAVAHEDGDNLVAAVRCYQQALATRDLGADAQQYVTQRLAALEGY